MRYRMRLGIVVALMLLMVGSRQAWAGASCPDCAPIFSGEQLERAVRSAGSGIHLKLIPGLRLGEVSLDEIKASGVIIESADPGQPATFTTLTLRNSQAITLRDLRFDGPINDLHYKLLVMESRDINMEGLSFVGDASAYDDERSFSALMLRQSKGLRLSHSRFEHFVFGVTLLDTDEVTLNDNVFLRMKEDGVRGGGNSHLVIRRNQIADSDRYPQGHPDGIQQWTTNVHRPAHDILIEDNLVLRGTGGAGQGIFINDEVGLPYENLVVRNNLVVGALYNGISVMGARDGQVTGNVILANPDQESWLRIERADGLLVADNRAGRFVFTGKPHDHNNRLLTPTSHPEKLTADWLERRGMSLAH